MKDKNKYKKEAQHNEGTERKEKEGKKKEKVREESSKKRKTMSLIADHKVQEVHTA